MASHTSLAIVATVATVFGIALTFQVRAGADKVAFPDNYATGVMYLSLDKPESKLGQRIPGHAAQWRMGISRIHSGKEAK